MIKDAFRRLTEERQHELIERGRDVYLRLPYERVTVRALTDALEINTATFYRYFDEKEDLSMLIFRRIVEHNAYTERGDVFDKFDDSAVTKKEVAFLNTIPHWTDAAQRKIYFEMNTEMFMPKMKRALQIRRLDGDLREDVIDDFVAYLYCTMEYNLIRYLQAGGGYDEQLFCKLKEYMLHVLLPRGIFKQNQEKQMEGEQENAVEERNDA